MKTFGIIEKLGGRQRVAALLCEAGRAITVDGVRMWSKRGQVPGAALQVLMAVAERKRIKVTAADLSLIDAPWGKSGRKAKVKR